MGSLESESTLAYRMLGIGLLCLAVFVPPLYGMEAKDCGFDDRLLEVNKTERSGLDPDEKSFDWSANKVRGRIIVPYRYVTQYQDGTPDGELESDNPSQNIRNAVKSAFRYVEEHVGCIKFEERNSDKKSLLMHINSQLRCGTGSVGHVHKNLPSDIYLQMDNAPCNKGTDRDFIEYIDKPLTTCISWAQSRRGPYCSKKGIYFSSAWFNTFVHEVFHVFGIAHTMRRTDRDNYIKVSDHTSKDPQFKKDALIPMPGGGEIPYECNSIMHYEPRSDEFEAIDPRTCKFGSKGPTDNDWKALKYEVCGH